MIRFEQMEHPFGFGGVHWRIEFWSETERAFPIGVAYAVELPEQVAAQVIFVLVGDQWRRQCVGTKLLEACKSRWSNVSYTGAMDEAGNGLLRKVRLCDDEE